MIYFTAVINWGSVIFNALWILGSAIILAAFSFEYGQINPETTFKHRLNEKPFLKSFWLGMVFINIGLAGTSQTNWERILWGAFTLVAFYTFIQSNKKEKE